MRALRVMLAALVVPALLAAAASAAPRLDYRGEVLTARQMTAIAADALRAPGDSAVARELLGRVVSRLQDLGYLDARATAAWESPASRGLRIEVDEGARYRLGEIRLHAPSLEDSLALGTAGLSTGAWASPARVGEAIERTLKEAVDRGYPYASLGVSRWDAERETVAVGLSGTLGPRVTVTRLRFEGLRVTQPRFLERAMGPIAGLPYNRAAAERGRERLAQLGLFRGVALEGLEGEADWSRGELVYRVEEPRYNRFEGSLGVQGDAGAVGLVRLDVDNLLGTGRGIGLMWESRGRGVTHLGGRYAEPLLFGAPLRLEGAFEQQVQDTLFVRTRWGARARYALSPEERLEAGYEQERVVQERQEVERAQLQSTVFALERSTYDPTGGVRRGSRVRIEAAQSFKSERLRPTGKRSARASAVELRAEWNLPVTGASGLALEIHSAGRFSSQRVLPFFERYPLGGAKSLRGFDEEAFRVDRYALARLEWRWFLGGDRQRAFLFWDHAHAGTRVAVPAGGDRLETFDRDGVGFGLRVEAAGGLMGLDYGLQPGRPPLEGKIHLQLVSAF